MKPLTDADLLDRLLDEDEYFDRLTRDQAVAFMGMRNRSGGLSPNQAKWVRGVAERLGIQVAPSENLFSNMDPEKQARQREAAKKVRLPWEK